jgi:hypothetical protein
VLFHILSKPVNIDWTIAGKLLAGLLVFRNCLSCSLCSRQEGMVLAWRLCRHASTIPSSLTAGLRPASRTGETGAQKALKLLVFEVEYNRGL